MSPRVKTVVKWIAIHWWLIPVGILLLKVVALEHAQNSPSANAEAIAAAHLEIANSKHEISVTRAAQTAVEQRLAGVLKELAAEQQRRAATDKAIDGLSATNAAVLERVKKGDPTVASEIDARFRARGLFPVPGVRP